MSGYLQRLVERTLGAGSTVQPRIAPRFAGTSTMVVEPPGLQESLQPAEQAGARAAEPESTDESAASTLLAQLPVPEIERSVTEAPVPQTRQVSPTLNLEGELPSPSWLEIEPHETLPEAGYPVGAREKYSQPGIVPLIENSPQETTTDNKGEAFLSDNQNTADASQEGAGEVGAKEKLGVQVSPRIIKTELRLHQHVDDLQDGQAQPLGENAVVRPRPAASAAEHKATGHKASIGSPTLPGSPKGSTPAGDQPQPVIRVTIGRVEVRAVAAPAPPSPRLAPPRPKPALSLQEYLEQRSGGER